MEEDKKILDFLKARECHISKINGSVDGWVAVDFADMEELREVFGSYPFNDSGFDARVMDGYLAINFSCLDLYWDNFQEVFPEDEWEEFSKIGAAPSIGSKVKMVNCEEAADHKGKLWTVVSEPWGVCGSTVVRLEDWCGGFDVSCLEVVEEAVT